MLFNLGSNEWLKTLDFCIGAGAVTSSEEQWGAVKSGSVWAVSYATTSRSVLSSPPELLGSLAVLCSSLEQRWSRTKLIQPHIPECSVSTKPPHSPFLILPRLPGVLVYRLAIDRLFLTTAALLLTFALLVEAATCTERWIRIGYPAYT